MPSRRVMAQPRVAALLVRPDPARLTASARLLPVGSALQRFEPELARLRRAAGASAAMTFSLDWWRAVPPPNGYAHRLLLLHRENELQAAVYLRERILLGLPTGVLHGGDAKGDGLVLCAPGQEAKWLLESIRALFRSRRCIALLLHTHARPTPAGSTGSDPAARFAEQLLGPARGLQVRIQNVPSYWRTALHPAFNQTLAPLGHRTRRNLRHELRRVAQNGWQFLPELTPAEVANATAALASRSTHPYGQEVITARLAVENSQPDSFSMGLRSARGEWLSLLSGVRRPDGATDIFWQSNVAIEHSSVALSMRALLMKHEGERGSSTLRWIGGTSPFLEHCCQPDPGTQTLITRPGLRLALLRSLLGTRLASWENPMRKLLQLEPSGA